MTVQSGRLSSGMDADSVAAQASRKLNELGFSARVGVCGGTVVLGPFTADALADLVAKQRREIQELRERLDAPAY